METVGMAKKSLPTFDDLRDEYTRLWSSAIPRVDKAKDVDATAKKILANRGRYEYIASLTGIPFYFVGVVHAMEGGCNFSTHLHNGDPLTKRTRQVPANRPKSGSPPFTWEESACDALNLKGLEKVNDWCIERICYELERYNGWGYRQYHSDVLSPYLWSGTSHYTKGKYVADGEWSSSAVSGQSGAVAILLRMAKLDKSITFTAADAPVTVDKHSKIEKVKEAAKLGAKAASEGARSWNGVAKIATFGGLVYSYFTDSMQWVFNGVFSLVDSLPDMTGQVESQLMSAEKVAGWVGIPWAQVNLGIIFALSALVVYKFFFAKGE